MGALYRRTKKDEQTSTRIPVGPWWMKVYDDGRPIYASTGKLEKRQAMTVMRKAEARIAEGRHEGPLVRRTRFDDLVADLKNDYEKKGRKTWKRREQHIAHLRPYFGGRRAAAITSSQLNEYAGKRLCEGAAPATVNRELDCLHRMMVLGQRHSPPKVTNIPHFEKLAENNVREGFCDHENYLCIRGGSAVPYPSSGHYWLLYGHEERRNPVAGMGEAYRLNESVHSTGTQANQNEGPSGYLYDR